jgi:hypothetical protein
MKLINQDLSEMQAVDDSLTQLKDEGAVVKEATVSLSSINVRVTYDSKSDEFEFEVTDD